MRDLLPAYPLGIHSKGATTTGTFIAPSAHALVLSIDDFLLNFLARVKTLSFTTFSLALLRRSKLTWFHNPAKASSDAYNTCPFVFCGYGMVRRLSRIPFNHLFTSFGTITTNLEEGKLRPALLLGKLPGEYDDWLICMISSQTRQYISGFDEIIEDGSEDFNESGLKVASVIRVGCLAVISGEILLGAIGEISGERLNRVKKNLSNWLSEK